MDTEVEMGRGNAMKMQVEISIWIAPNVPGAAEMRAFYQKNAANFPWSAMINGGGNQSITKAMAQVQKKLAEIDGTPVEEVVRVKPASGAGAPQVAQDAADDPRSAGTNAGGYGADAGNVEAGRPAGGSSPAGDGTDGERYGRRRSGGRRGKFRADRNDDR